MKSKNTYPGSKVTTNYPRILSGYFAVLLISFMTFFQSSVAFANSLKNETKSLASSSVVLTNGHSNNFLIPFCIPIDPEQTEENPGQSEVKESSGKEFSDCGINTSIDEYFRFYKSKSIALNYISAIQNRKTVSLFILHHSWKNHFA